MTKKANESDEKLNECNSIKVNECGEKSGWIWRKSEWMWQKTNECDEKSEWMWQKSEWV